MTRRRVAVGLLVVAAVLVGVQLVDPFRSAEVPEPVDLSDRPAGVAEAALEQPDAGDYTLEVRYWSEETGRTGVSRVLVEHSEGELLVEGAATGPGSDGYRRYVTRDVAWRGWGSDLERWPASYEDLASPYDGAEGLSNRTVTVTHENESALVLSVNDTDAAYRIVRQEANVTGSEWGREVRIRARLRIHVDRDAGRLGRVVLDGSRLADPPENRTRVRFRIVHSYSRWGATEARRPAGAGYTLAEFLFDLTDYRP